MIPLRQQHACHHSSCQHSRSFPHRWVAPGGLATPLNSIDSPYLWCPPYWANSLTAGSLQGAIKLVVVSHEPW